MPKTRTESWWEEAAESGGGGAEMEKEHEAKKGALLS